MSRKRLLPFVLLSLVVAAGCPQSSSVPGPISTPGAGQIAPTEELKGQLESLAETGEAFPGMETMADNIAAFKAADAQKGAALEKAFEGLNAAMGNPDDVKAKATEMLKML